MRGLLGDAIGLVGSGLLTLVLLRYLHTLERGWMPGTAAVGGVLVGVVVRRAVLSSWEDVPPFLARPALAGVLVVGALLVALASLAGYRPEYWLTVGPEALTLLAVAVLLGLSLSALGVSHRRYAAAIEAHRVRESELARAELAARLSALQAQMNPHFLFNTLNGLAELVHDDPAAAEAVVEDLAHLLRYSLRSSSGGSVPLAREWEAIERTLRIERARFGDRLAVTLDLDPALSGAAVPGLLLQPIVENAVQHAIAPRSEGGRIEVRAVAVDGRVVLSVEDDGPGLPEVVRTALAGDGPMPGGGSGGAGGALANVRDRLRLAGGAAGDLRVVPSPLGGARIEIELPREEASP